MILNDSDALPLGALSGINKNPNRNFALALPKLALRRYNFFAFGFFYGRYSHERI